MNSPLLTLIQRDQWGSFQPMMDRFQHWEGYPLFLEKCRSLNRKALYQSLVHGEGHIERTMLHGAFCAMEEHLSMEDTALLLECCAYHDVGRVDDSLDNDHGFRSSQRVMELTGRSGEEAVMMMAVIHAHSLPEKELIPTLKSYAPKDWDRCFRLAQLMKDADGLDRVRIWDLDIRHLRRESSKQREDFAEYLFEVYQREINASNVPPFSKELVDMLLEKRTRRDRERGRTSFHGKRT